jgi:purine-binding chemotaxis protein CheW
MSKIHLPPSGLAEDFVDVMDDQKEEFQLVTFSLGEQYGVPINQVQEIIRVGDVTAVPNSPPFMEGVINLRGRVLPVMNIRRKLQLPAGDITKNSRIIVTEINGKLVGVLVDSVSHVLKVPPELIESAPEEVLEVDTDYITGVSKIKESLVIMLDLEKLLRREKLEVKEGNSYGTKD